MSGSTILTGGCLCGAVRYRVAALAGPVLLCHCGQCRKAQGSAFAANVPVRTEDFTLLAGAEALTAYASSPGKWRSFCRHCGAPIHSRRDSAPGMLRLRVGSLDDGPAAPLRPAGHIHVASKAAWWEIGDDLPRHPGIEPGRR
ncbi:MAG TPA: GFA family protein [Methylibium sp.]|nr:GFA family protein [Methylibium sp.]